MLASRGIKKLMAGLMLGMMRLVQSLQRRLASLPDSLAIAMRRVTVRILVTFPLLKHQVAHHQTLHN